jgi:hypothetical protein
MEQVIHVSELFVRGKEDVAFVIVLKLEAR